MRKTGVTRVPGLILLALLLAACAGYTETGTKTTSHQGANGGDVTVEISKANGTSSKDIEVADGSDLTLEADVTLAVGKGSYKIELLGQNDQVTLALEARDGQTVSGHGQMVTDSFGQASYRVTALEAEKVAYTIQYTFQ
jgi:hypothetical protein